MYPIHLNLGFRIFHYYEGLYFFISILAAAAYAYRRQRRAGLDATFFLDNLLWILLGSFVGGPALPLPLLGARLPAGGSGGLLPLLGRAACPSPEAWREAWPPHGSA